MKKNQPIQSGVLISSQKDDSKRIEESKEEASENISDAYGDFDKKEVIPETFSRNSKLRSEEQGRNVSSTRGKEVRKESSEFKEQPTHRTMEVGKQPHIQAIENKQYESAKNLPHVRFADQIAGSQEESLNNQHKTFNAEHHDKLIGDDEIELKGYNKNSIDESKDNVLVPNELLTTPESLDDKMLVSHLHNKFAKNKKGSKFNITLNVGNCNTRDDRSVSNLSTLQLTPERDHFWKNTPLYKISHG